MALILPASNSHHDIARYIAWYCQPHLVQNLIMIFWCSLTLAKKCNSNEFSNSQEITLQFCPFILTYKLEGQKCQQTIFCIFFWIFWELDVMLTFLRSNISTQQILILVFLSAFLRYLSDSVLHRNEEVWNERSLGHCVHLYRNSIRDPASDAVASCYGWTNFQSIGGNKSSVNENMLNERICMLWWLTIGEFE